MSSNNEQERIKEMNKVLEKTGREAQEVLTELSDGINDKSKDLSSGYKYVNIEFKGASTMVTCIMSTSVQEPSIGQIIPIDIDALSEELLDLVGKYVTEKYGQYRPESQKGDITK